MQQKKLFLFITGFTVMIQTFFSYNVQAFIRKPSYAQYSSNAIFNSLGIAGAYFTQDTSNIYYIPSAIPYKKDSNFLFSYGYEGSDIHVTEFNILTPLKGTSGHFLFGFGMNIGFLDASKTFQDEKITTNHPFYASLNSALIWYLGNYGVMGFSLKIPMDYYKSNQFNAGLLFGASYSLKWLGLDVSVGINNIGFMEKDQHISGIYPDLDLGVAYNYIGENGEKVVSFGFSLENNLGEYIANSNIIGLALSSRVFSTNLKETVSMLEDPGIDFQDDIEQVQSNENFYANVYVNFGFMFYDATRFSCGVQSQLQSYILSVGIIFPSSKTKVFSIYGTLENKF